MEEITLRFEIIRLAVELGDFEAINLQCKKLRSLSLDEKLDEIIDLLESRSYRQALFAMKHYHQSLEDEFFIEATKKQPESKSKPRKKEQNAWHDKGLFAMEEPEHEEEHVLNLDDILRLSAEAQEEAPTKKVQADETEEKEEISAENPEIHGTSHAEEKPEPVTEEDKKFETEQRLSSLSNAIETLSQEDDFEGKDETSSVATALEEDFFALPSEEKGEERHDLEIRETSEYEKTEEVRSETLHEPESFHSTSVSEEKDYEAKSDEESGLGEVSYKTSSVVGDGEKYPPISYIGQKFRNMQHQFPPIERSEVLPPEVERMRKKIAQEGYTEEEIEAFLRHYQEYKSQGKRAEAAQVLLLAAATESKFAQFLLARELFKGEVIQEDHAESFTQINTLADQNFAEAICDLGQFYEYGVGIGKDRQMALLLYEEAAELGVARARKHYERLKNSNGLMGIFKKVKVPLKLPKKS